MGEVQMLRSLSAVRNAPRILEAFPLADELARTASVVREEGSDEGVRQLIAALSETDHVTVIAAIYALARVSGGDGTEESRRALEHLHTDYRGFVRDHAVAAMRASAPMPTSVPWLLDCVGEGGFRGMQAQRTLESWANRSTRNYLPELVASLTDSAVRSPDPVRARRHIETLGLLRDDRAEAALTDLAHDAALSDDSRRAAQEALAYREDLAWLTSERRRASPSGLTVAQSFMQGEIDPELRNSGSGSTGGISTLLVGLGDALCTMTNGSVQVLTISRGGGANGRVQETPTHRASRNPGHRFAHIAFETDSPGEGAPSQGAQVSDPWSEYAALRRGILRSLRQSGGVDVIHLRMADVGTLAAWDLAALLQLPVVFTAAPDPHAIIEAMELSGDITRESFGDRDARERLWVRGQLVRQLARDAAHTVLLPRADVSGDALRLLGIDIDQDPEQFSVVAEGIDLAASDRADDRAWRHRADVVSENKTGLAADPPTVQPVLHGAADQDDPIEALRALLGQLPEERRRLPLIVTVGRMHRVKGMATLVRSWARSELRHRCNLLIVGGNLKHPSGDEEEQLQQIDLEIPRPLQAGAGLLLSGHRPNAVVAEWVASVRFGLAGYAAAGGVYVCASVKEEFGLAIIEALAAGAFVVAPVRGGPSTYLDQGRTGLLCDTTDQASLARTIREALDLAGSPHADERADEARRMVRERFSVHRMSEALSTIYRRVQHLPRDADFAELERSTLPRTTSAERAL